MKFKLGDKVRVTDEDEIFKGKEGLVFDIWEDDDNATMSYEVLFSRHGEEDRDSFSLMFAEHELEKIDEV
jgi:hypothetical protein